MNKENAEITVYSIVKFSDYIYHNLIFDIIDSILIHIMCVPVYIYLN